MSEDIGLGNIAYILFVVTFIAWDLMSRCLELEYIGGFSVCIFQ